MSRFDVARQRMVAQQLSEISDQRVLAAMGTVPRHLFVPPVMQSRAYQDGPLPIAEGQTISQPWIVARMTELLELENTDKVLEIGTGSAYQTAVLASLCRQVISVERHGSLAKEAARRLGELGVRNVTVLAGDGSMGRSEFGPFAAILVTAGAPETPRPLLAQLAVGGRLVVPVGTYEKQSLVRVRRQPEGDEPEFVEESFAGCRFVPLVGRFGWKEVR